ncbi:hypothetical protein D3C81_606450 [compost metagenome]
MSNNTDPKIQEIRETLGEVEHHGYVGGEVYHDDIAYLLSEYNRLQAERKEMEGVLKWYADKDNYDPEHLSKFGYIPIDKDEGKRAMAALSHLKG